MFLGSSHSGEETHGVLRKVTREFLGLKIRNFQGIVFI